MTQETIKRQVINQPLPYKDIPRANLKCLYFSTREWLPSLLFITLPTRGIRELFLPTNPYVIRVDVVLKSKHGSNYTWSSPRGLLQA